VKKAHHAGRIIEKAPVQFGTVQWIYTPTNGDGLAWCWRGLCSSESRFSFCTVMWFFEIAHHGRID
jgi:hypothetical protein